MFDLWSKLSRPARTMWVCILVVLLVMVALSACGDDASTGTTAVSGSAFDARWVDVHDPATARNFRCLSSDGVGTHGVFWCYEVTK